MKTPNAGSAWRWMAAAVLAHVSRPAGLDATNRPRVEGTRNLLDAAIRAGTRRFLVGSFAMLSPREEGRMATEAPAVAVRSMEAQVLDASAHGTIEGVVLRYGLFHGAVCPRHST